MSLSRSSKVGFGILVLLLATAVPTAAVSVSTDDTPEEAQLGEQISATYTATELYENQSDTWTLSGSTDLQSVTWTVELYDQTGAQIGSDTVTGQEFSQEISADDGVNEVVVTVEGTVTDEESAINWSYDPPQSLVVASFDGGQPGGAVDHLANFTTQPYTQESQQARSAIDDAAQAIEDARDAGAGVSDAEDLLESAIESYDSGEFATAEDVANSSANQATGARESSEQTSLLIKVGIGIVVLLLLAGGVYLYLQRRQTHDELG